MAQRSHTLLYYQPDISIRGEDGQSIALVQVKNARVLSRDIALALYHDIIAESTASYAPYFLLLSQRLGFLWKQRGRRENVSPMVEFPMEGVVARYLPALTADEWLRGRELDFIVSQWLADLAIGLQPSTGEPEKSLAEFGFLAAIEGALVRIGTIA